MARDIAGGGSPPKRESRPAGNGTALLENRSGNATDIVHRVEPVNLLDVRFARSCERLHALGPRALGEFLAELGAKHLIRHPIEEQLARYATLDPAILKALGGDTFPPSIHAVEPDR